MQEFVAKYSFHSAIRQPYFLHEVNQNQMDKSVLCYLPFAFPLSGFMNQIFKSSCKSCSSEPTAETVGCACRARIFSTNCALFPCREGVRPMLRRRRDSFKIWQNGQSVTRSREGSSVKSIRLSSGCFWTQAILHLCSKPHTIMYQAKTNWKVWPTLQNCHPSHPISA